VSTNALGALLVVIGYLSGSIPFGFVLSRVFLGIDVRKVGSGNIGGTNVARVNKKLGIATIVLDMLKAVIPLLVARRLLAGAPNGDLWVMGVAVAAFVGHCYTVWLGFRGGKGVASAFGVYLVLAPALALAGVATWAGTYLVTRMSSLGSLLGTLVCVVGMLFTRGPAHPLTWSVIAVGGLIFWKHRENIRRIVTGEEKRRMRV
jgi:acyl phosphate:glycerol-3-phosphate acyltransferase